jgi:hypothetical protein
MGQVVLWQVEAWFLVAVPRNFASRRVPFHRLNRRMNAHVYEVRPRKDRRGVDLISDALPFGRLWYGGPNAASNAIGYASHYSRADDQLFVGAHNETVSVAMCVGDPGCLFSHKQR